MYFPITFSNYVAPGVARCGGFHSSIYKHGHRVPVLHPAIGWIGVAPVNQCCPGFNAPSCGMSNSSLMINILVCARMQTTVINNQLVGQFDQHLTDHVVIVYCALSSPVRQCTVVLLCGKDSLLTSCSPVMPLSRKSSG